jgi:hypothetical protein
MWESFKAAFEAAGEAAIRHLTLQPSAAEAIVTVSHRDLALTLTDLLAGLPTPPPTVRPRVGSGDRLRCLQ